MPSQQKTLLPFIAIFSLFGIAVVLMRTTLDKWGLDYRVLLVANALFFIISIITFLLQQKALSHKNPNVFVRSILGSVMIKMFGCVIAIILYRLLAPNSFSKMSVFVAMFLYLIYLAIEVKVILKLNKKPDA
ncbi:hypothetical protein LK994_10795 [Ferruginibacter lapsinanis]|uniref:hypothetical protein n=1 Tax=Ferruginibacter lapsinanis TaxID=563172 RepID=UPI001E470E0C|nr:hypothetical protein [Ferruginibacter lapsinanis]UEG49118.1 hypothetical protein LK994_10795 [Ferruginibacter lapsinanis]